MRHLEGTDAPICQDTRSGGLDDLLASAEIGHDALVDLASEETFQAPDDLSPALTPLYVKTIV